MDGMQRRLAWKRAAYYAVSVSLVGTCVTLPQAFYPLDSYRVPSAAQVQFSPTLVDALDLQAQAASGLEVEGDAIIIRGTSPAAASVAPTSAPPATPDSVGQDTSAAVGESAPESAPATGAAVTGQLFAATTEAGAESGAESGADADDNPAATQPASANPAASADTGLPLNSPDEPIALGDDGPAANEPLPLGREELNEAAIHILSSTLRPPRPRAYLADDWSEDKKRAAIEKAVLDDYINSRILGDKQVFFRHETDGHVSVFAGENDEGRLNGYFTREQVSWELGAVEPIAVDDPERLTVSDLQAIAESIRTQYPDLAVTYPHLFKFNNVRIVGGIKLDDLSIFIDDQLIKTYPVSDLVYARGSERGAVEDKPEPVTPSTPAATPTEEAPEASPEPLPSTPEPSVETSPENTVEPTAQPSNEPSPVPSPPPSGESPAPVVIPSRSADPAPTVELSASPEPSPSATPTPIPTVITLATLQPNAALPEVPAPLVAGEVSLPESPARLAVRLPAPVAPSAAPEVVTVPDETGTGVVQVAPRPVVQPVRSQARTVTHGPGSWWETVENYVQRYFGGQESYLVLASTGSALSLLVVALLAWSKRRREIKAEENGQEFRYRF